MLELGAVDWPLLEDATRRAAFVRDLRDALRLEDPERRWETLAANEGCDALEFLGHLISLIALGLQLRVGRRVHRRAVHSSSGPPAKLLVVWEHFFLLEGVSAGRRALELLQACAGTARDRKPGKAKLAEHADAAVARLRDDLPDPVADVIMEGMTARGLPWRVFDHQWPIFEVGTGCRRQRLMTSMPDSQSHIDRLVFRNKFLAGAILREAGLPMPEHALTSSAEKAVEAAERIGYPVVVKPVDSGRSRGVTVNITGPEAIPAAFDFAREYGSAVLVERFIPGLPYRILILEGEVIAASLRGIPSVTGDGAQNVAELIEEENRRRAEENLTLRHPWPLIDIAAYEAECRERLEGQGLALDAVPEAGREVWLAHHAQRGRGGLNVDVTAEIHPDHFELAAQISEIMRCPIIGIDFITEDIRRSFREVACGINEVNIEPALNLHMRMTRAPRDVVAPLLERLFPEGDEGRVPLLAVYGAAPAPLEPLCRALAASGRRVGLAKADGETFIGGRPVGFSNRAGGRVEHLLFDPRAEALVMELAMSDFAHGLAIDRTTATLFLPPPEGALPDGYVIAARLLAALTGGPAVLPLEALAAWRDRFGEFERPAVLFGDAPPEAAAMDSLLRAGHSIVAPGPDAIDGLGVYHDRGFDLLIRCDGAGSELRQGLLIAAAGLIGLGFAPADARRWLNDAGGAAP
jgi:cyanophycin synthetase